MGQNITGQILLNRYRVDSFIASGGMATVFRVWDIQRSVPLAMKMLHADLAEDPSIFKRFEREASALQRLAHPHIVPFYGFFQTPEFAFLLEGYIDGPSLKDMLYHRASAPGTARSAHPLPIEEVLIYAKTLCSALGYAHSIGIIHCDVKPGNILLDRGGNIFVTDFGIARFSDSTSTTLASLGTASYMAPEQIRGESVSPATDIYSLGVLLYEMLTGIRPFRLQGEMGSNTANEYLRHAHLFSQPDDPRLHRPNIAPAVAQTILACLQKDVRQRPQSTQDLLTLLCQAVGVNPDSIPDRLPGAIQPPSSPSAPPPNTTYFPATGSPQARTAPLPNLPAAGIPPYPPLQQPQPASSSRLPILFALSGAVFLIILLILGFVGGQNKTSQPDTQTIHFTATQPASNTPPLPTPTNPEFIPSPTIALNNTPLATLPPTPTLAPMPPMLVYARGAVGNSDIYSANADGSGEKCISCQSNCDESEPGWKPGGYEIVFQSNCSGNFELWKANTQTGVLTQLTFTQDVDEREPDWSADDWIVYRANPVGSGSNQEGDLYLIKSDSSGVTTLGITGRGPAWSPNASQIAYMARDGAWKIFVYSLSTSYSLRVSNGSTNCRWPAWSPDGNNIIYNTANSNMEPDAIWYIPANGGTAIQVIEGGQGRPSWSENGWIAFNAANSIDIVKSDGNNHQILIPGAWAPAWSR